MGPKPQFFSDFLNFGDFIYLRKEDEFFILDQIPTAETSLISISTSSKFRTTEFSEQIKF